MNRQKENSISLTERAIMIGLFLFVVFLFKNTDCTQKYFFSQSHPVSIEHVFDVDHSVILAKSTFFPDINNSFVACKIPAFNACDKINFKMICSNCIVDQLFKNCREQFVVIKPRIFYMDSYYIRVPLHGDEIPSIS